MSKFQDFHKSAPGEWITPDGEYLAKRAGRSYDVFYTAQWTGVRGQFERRHLATVRTLTEATRAVARHRYAPVHDPNMCGECAEREYR